LLLAPGAYDADAQVDENQTQQSGIDGNDFGHRLTSQGLTETRAAA